MVRKYAKDAGREPDPSVQPYLDADRVSDPNDVGPTDHLFIQPLHSEFRKDQLIRWIIHSRLIVKKPSGEEDKFHIAFSNAEGTADAWGAIYRHGIVWSQSIADYSLEEIHQMVYHKPLQDLDNPPMLVNHDAG